MSATEWWCLAAVIVAAAATLLRLMTPLPSPLDRLASALGAAAVGLVAVALLIALP